MRHPTFAGSIGATTLIAVGALAWPAASNAASCTPKTNIQAIIDDSGSMMITDPNTLRVQALNLFLQTPGNGNRTLGAVEFGTSAKSIFLPSRIGSNPQIKSDALTAAVTSDDGLTNYNDAFTLAKAENPGADARIFLTDGAHNAKAYENGHRGGPPTHVIGLGNIGIAGDTLLKQIARETRGSYRAVATAAELQSAMNAIQSSLACQKAPTTFVDTIKTGQRRSHKVTLSKKVRSISIAITWSDPADAFDLRNVRVVRTKTVRRNGKRIKRTVTVRRSKQLKIVERRGATFLTLRVGKVKPGTLVFQVRGKSVTSAPKVTVTTQASRAVAKSTKAKKKAAKKK